MERFFNKPIVVFANHHSAQLACGFFGADGRTTELWGRISPETIFAVRARQPVGGL